MAMMRAAVPGSSFWLAADLPQRTEAARHEIESMGSSGSSDEESSGHDAGDDGGTPEAWTAAQSAAGLADEMNGGALLFHRWQPPDGIMRHIRNAVCQAGQSAAR